MSKLKTLVVILMCLVMVFPLTVCKSAPAPAQPANQGQNQISLQEAQALAQGALDRMDGVNQPAQCGGAAAPRPTTPQPAATTPAAPTITEASGNNPPAWANDPYVQFPRSQFLAAVGTGSNRANAERDALAKLVGIFGQDIRANQTMVTAFSETVRSGAASSWTERTDVEDVINISASMDNLIGAEIRAVYRQTPRGGDVWFAAAVMDRAVSGQSYTRLIQSNLNLINNVLNMTPAEKNSFDGVARYQFAATIADINTPFVKVLDILNVPPPAGVRTGAEYRAEIQNIVRTIPVRVVVQNDRNNRISGAFASALGHPNLRFVTGGTASRYVLNVDVQVSPQELPNQTNRFSRIEVTANLSDTLNNTVIIPWNFNRREGHATQAEADQRAYTAAERFINENYANHVINYLNTLLPTR